MKTKAWEVLLLALIQLCKKMSVGDKSVLNDLEHSGQKLHKKITTLNNFMGGKNICCLKRYNIFVYFCFVINRVLFCLGWV
jgi:hypothetical protein